MPQSIAFPSLFSFGLRGVLRTPGALHPGCPASNWPLLQKFFQNHEVLLIRKSLSCLPKVVLRNASSSTNRSEEHTSELQSRGHLVCRLLLEKKKLNKINTASLTYNINITQ